MWNPFKRQLNSPTYLDFNKLSPDKQKEILEAMQTGATVSISNEQLGDGKAVFMDEGTHEEWEDLKKEESGLKPWYKRIGL